MPYPRNKAIQRPISAAPKDRNIYVVNPDDGKLWLVKWDPSGDSWDGNVLVNTGFWLCDNGHGWFEPDEVQYWYPVEEVYVG